MLGNILVYLRNDVGSLYKEMELEVSLTRVRVVERFCIGVTTKGKRDLVTEKDTRRLKSCHLLALVRDKKGWAGLHDIDAVRICLLIVAELVFMGKEDRNCIPRHLVTLAEDLDAWNDYPWGEYMWENFYERTINIVDEHRQHHLDEKKKNPNYNATYNLYGFAWAFKDSIPIVNLDPTPAEKIQAWFDISIPFFNGIVDEDGKGCGDDSVLVSKDNSVDEDCNVCEDASAGLSKDEFVNDKLVDEDCNVCEDASAGLSKDEILNDKLVDEECNVCEDASACLCEDNAVNQKSVGNNDQVLLEDGDGLFDSEVDLNSNQTGVDQELGGAANDPMPIPASVDALIQACAYASDHPELDVLQHEAHVDRSGPKINEHPMAEPLTADEFRDDYMSVLNDEEIIPNVSLDDMKFQHEEENFPVKDTPLEHQPVDELIDAQKDSTNLLPENVKDEINKSKYVNVVKADYKAPLETRKKKLAMALGSPYGQLGTTTLAPPKTRSVTSIGDTIVAPEFEVEISRQPKIRSLNELLTLQVFVENLSRPDGCKKDKVTVPDEISEFLKMQDPPEYRFPWGFRDITVDRIFWLQLACLDLAKKAGWEIVTWIYGLILCGLFESPTQIGLWQADESGDCGVWVCIFLYRLSRKQPLTFKDPIQTVLAYRETMLQYFWNHKFAAPKAVLMDEGEVPNLAIISDRHYAIILACKTVFPNSFHSFCYRHLMMNYGMQSERYKVLYWSTCKAYTEQEFDKLMSDIQAVRPDAHYKLVEAGIEKWSRAKCPANRYNYMTLNSVESVNALTKEVRKIPITALMDWYRDRLRKWYNIYEVRDNKMIHMVYLEKGECTCRRWQLSSLPSGHVYAIARVEALTNVNNLEKTWFLTSTIKATYEGIVYPVKDIPTWQTPNDLQSVLPPVMSNKLPGRPKNKDQIRSQGEGPILTRCGRCGAMGHNRTACNVPLPSVQNTEEANHEVYQQGMYEP
ncbi:phospholipase-like protein [Tanacetum coccineum]